VTLFRRSATLVERKVGDVWLVAPPGTEFACYRFEGTSARAWELLAKPTTPERLTAELADAYDVDRRRIASEVVALLVDLERQSCIERVAGDA
jgi:Coenzyme PQQ synthesis protein D (PqqD)